MTPPPTTTTTNLSLLLLSMERRRHRQWLVCLLLLFFLFSNAHGDVSCRGRLIPKRNRMITLNNARGRLSRSRTQLLTIPRGGGDGRSGGGRRSDGTVRIKSSPTRRRTNNDTTNYGKKPKPTAMRSTTSRHTTATRHATTTATASTPTPTAPADLIREKILLLRNGYLNYKIYQRRKKGRNDQNDSNSRMIPTTYSNLNSSSSSSSTNSNANNTNNFEYDPLKMYTTCMGIVFVWITSGTLFYSWLNEWPIPQSFFYAVDAGMSIGFCTDVHEIKLISKAFTIIYILLGASVVGGALALFIQDAVEGISMPSTKEYQLLLERDAFNNADVSHTGSLSYDEFRSLILSTVSATSSSKTSSTRTSPSSTLTSNQFLTEEDIQHLWKKFDRLKDGVIHFEEFVGTYRGIGQLIDSLKKQQQEQQQQQQQHHYVSVPIMGVVRRYFMQLKLFLMKLWRIEHRIYVMFCLWVSSGILWGITRQKWDPITATHFAISALATGGLTAPSVNSNGILEPEPAIFCGVFCLLGIPLFALTLGHFARVLVSHHINAMERKALTRPLTRAEFDLAKHLTTPRDSLVHLSDFIVLQLLRQGRISEDTIRVLKQNFDLLDVNNKGSLTLEEATSAFSPPSNTK